jgi:hypothetical protein
MSTNFASVLERVTGLTNLLAKDHGHFALAVQMTRLDFDQGIVRLSSAKRSRVDATPSAS